MAELDGAVKERLEGLQHLGGGAGGEVEQASFEGDQVTLAEGVEATVAEQGEDVDAEVNVVVATRCRSS
ncbi:MAG: hypothetical protein IPK80_03240 [Nannocystis sp.]|nr:hypothetical protein [Nannocystis sp.]